ncbi:hypothetical protein [uncultured Oscillibacter sp.]|uniref:hypothetical protein n=1 Tax=Dysosmobacter sp. TaxID=2591382 RepID=UPI00261A186C|nr:hypothetical protein [uncultured Oscillibacter sp.]
MANIKHRMQSTLHGLFQKGRGMKKKSDPTHQYIHSRVTLQTYLAEVDRFSKWIKDQGIKMRCSEQEAAKQVPRYLRGLAQAGRSPSTIHTAAAALCKALPGTGLVMADLPHPRRTHAPRKGRAAAPSLRRRSDADAQNPKYRRLVDFAKVVGLRRDEYRNLRGRDLTHIDGHAYVIVERGKGGKTQYQRIDDVDAPLIESYFMGLEQDDPVFSEEEMKNKINLHRLRREHAQEMYRRYLARLEADPTYQGQLLREIKEAFRRAGQDWRRNPDMRRLATPYVCRGHVRESLDEAGRAVAYDRLALMAVSVFHLAHWRADVTVKNYMQ